MNARIESEVYQVRTGRVGKNGDEARTCGSSVSTANCVRYYGDELRQQHRRLLIVPNVQIKHQVRANKVQMTPTSEPHTIIPPYNKCRRRLLRSTWILVPLPSIRQHTTKWMLSFTARNWNILPSVVLFICPVKINTHATKDEVTEEACSVSSTRTTKTTGLTGCRESARNRAVYRQTICQERHSNRTQYTFVS